MVVASSKVIADRLNESILMFFFLLEKVSLLVDPAVIDFSQRSSKIIKLGRKDVFLFVR